MKKKDLYTVFIFKDGTRFYFKNNHLHRELGPSIICSLASLDKDAEAKYINLGDENLYNKVYHKNSRKDYITFKFSDGTKAHEKSPLRYMYSNSFYLDNTRFTEEGFKQQLLFNLKDQLEESLEIKEISLKKPKV